MPQVNRILTDTTETGRVHLLVAASAHRTGELAGRYTVAYSTNGKPPN
jgi:hypothetical protein